MEKARMMWMTRCGNFLSGKRKIARWLVVAIFALVSRGMAMKCPEGYILRDGTTSPDGHYGIFVMSREAADRPGDDDKRVLVNYVVDLASREILMELPTGYCEGMNRHSIEVAWTGDSSLFLLRARIRWWNDHVMLVSIRDGKAALNDLTKVLSTAVPKEQVDVDGPWIGADTHGKLVQLAQLSDDNPKAENRETHRFAFNGYYDIEMHGWVSIKTAPVGLEEWKVAVDDPQEDDGSGRNRHDRMDASLNRIYALLREREKPETFAKLRDEQREWLKGSGKAGSPEKNDVRLGLRVHQLRSRLMKVLVGEVR